MIAPGKQAARPPTLIGVLLWGLVVAIGFAVVIYASTFAVDFVYGNV